MQSYNDEMYHWGILGMKWGRRRYQNSDGSLTDAGKKRYGKNGKSGSVDYRKAQAERERHGGGPLSKKLQTESESKIESINSEWSRATTPGLKAANRLVGKYSSRKRAASAFENLDELSDQELSSRINRLQLQQKYAELTAPPDPKGVRYTKDAIEAIADAAVLITAGTFVYQTTKPLVISGLKMIARH